MKKFVFVYYGGKNPHDLDKEEMKGIMDKWTKWFDSFKGQTADSGNPFGENREVTPEGVKPVAPDMWPAKGYSILNAENIDEVLEIAKKCPILEEGNGATVRVYEAMPM